MSEQRHDSLAAQIHAVASRAVRDPRFGTELKQAALAAVRAGSASEEWQTYFEYFASTPGELAALGSGVAEDCPCQSNTYLTLSSIVTPIPTCCNTTTTTTTTGNFFVRAPRGDG